MEIGAWGGGNFFEVGLETPYIKCSEYESQAKQKESNFTISHFLSPRLTSFG